MYESLYFKNWDEDGKGENAVFLILEHDGKNTLLAEPREISLGIESIKGVLSDPLCSQSRRMACLAAENAYKGTRNIEKEFSLLPFHPVSKLDFNLK